MLKAIIVGFVVLGSVSAHAQVTALERVVALASTQSKTSSSAIVKNLFSQVEGASGALSQAVKNDPLYIFNHGNLNEESLRYLGADAQSALLQIGRSTTFKGVSSLAEFENALSSVSALSRAAEHTPLSATGSVKSAVSVEALIEQDIRALGLSEPVTQSLANELKTFRSETGISYTNKGMCKGLDDEAATNFVGFLRDARENLKKTRLKCPAQFYGSIAEVWIHFQKQMGRSGDTLWRAVQKNQTCYTSARLRPGVLNAVNQISEKNSGQVPAENELTGCPL
jgi:hypothetical protein